uniref:Uncharacterized protein LOC111110423 isoform X2 n=1 Tax=Crassostrea virginica TaxID=6565 RepID=A0A8B8BIH5_CRAVI|nr:uncharacterized protein LOC111110423 isoform X2 [Crassostrea virginica]
MYTRMFNINKGSCPYENWTSVARARCEKPDHFHCLRDEDGRIGWVCAEPIWVEKGRCPIFNIVANKLDTSECTKSKCPSYSYRSNEIDVGRRRLFPNTNRQMETNPAESGKLVEDEKSEDLAYESCDSFHQAKEILDKHNRILITGVQGAGKTYLAKSLAAELGKKGKKLEKIWISNLNQLREKQNKLIPEGIFILDEIFYELQTTLRIMETFNVLQSFLESSVNKTVIITMPSYVWNKYEDMFKQARLDVFHIDLNHRNTGEKRSILIKILKQYAVSGEEAERLLRSEFVLLEGNGTKAIGFPGLISWLCTTPSKENIERLISNPLSAMSREIEAMKNSRDKQERGMYLILAYMALHDRDLDVNNVYENLFDELKSRFEPNYDLTNLEKYAEMMVSNHFLVKSRDGNFEFNLNIMKKIVFVSVAEYNVCFIQRHCKKDHYLRYIIAKENFDEEIKETYSECFIKI